MPDGVRQEIFGYLCVHYAIRWLMHAVALEADAGPDRLSFTRTLRAGPPGRTRVFPLAHSLTHRSARQEIPFERLPERRLRAAPRVVKRKMSNYGVKRAAHRNWAQPTMAPLGHHRHP
jgi:hypothetical protein